MFETSLKKGELIEAVEFQIPEKSCYKKYPNPASRYAIVGVYVAKHKVLLMLRLLALNHVFIMTKIFQALYQKAFLHLH